jgi:hypothetical protein
MVLLALLLATLPFVLVLFPADLTPARAESAVTRPAAAWTAPRLVPKGPTPIPRPIPIPQNQFDPGFIVPWSGPEIDPKFSLPGPLFDLDPYFSVPFPSERLGERVPLGRP